LEQSKLESAIETFLNVGSGFIISFAFWKYFVMPMIEYGYIEINDTTIITGMFTVISVIRGYYWRRMFSKKLPHRIVEYVKQYVIRN